jgi:hypothetical protein
MSRPSWISRRSWYSPRFQWHYWRAKRRESRLIQQPCSEGNCVELIDPKTGENTGGWGPVECPCQDTETRPLPPESGRA